MQQEESTYALIDMSKNITATGHSFPYFTIYTHVTNTENSSAGAVISYSVLLLLYSENVTTHSSIILFLRLTFDISPHLHHVISFPLEYKWKNVTLIFKK